MPGLGGFSRYELQERIGIGGMAEVFRARAFDASGAAHDVVVKKILPHHNEEAEFRTMFMDEARIAANLDHPNVVRVLDLGRLDGDLFLTMEYIEGTDLLRLSEWMEGAGRRMPIATALYLGIEILKGLHHAHTRVDKMGRPLGIVHRDVTPQNVLVSAQGTVKLTDFGIARAANRLSHTQVGTIKGNLLYSSPEQISGTAIDARADVYSCGILLHRLLGGRHPFDGDDLPKIYQRALSGDIPPVSKANAQVPTNLDRIIARATALVPDQRFATADELRRALEEFFHGKRLSVDLKALCADVRAKKSGLRAASKPDGRVLFTENADDGSVLSTAQARLERPTLSETEGPTRPVALASAPAADRVGDGPTTVQRMPDLPPEPALIGEEPRPSMVSARQAIDEWSTDEKTSPMLPAPSKPGVEAAVEEESTTRNPIPSSRSTMLVPRETPAPAPSPLAQTPMLSSRPPMSTPDPDAAPTVAASMPPIPGDPLTGPPIPEITENTPALSALVRDALADEVADDDTTADAPAPLPEPRDEVGDSTTTTATVTDEVVKLAADASVASPGDALPPGSEEPAQTKPLPPPLERLGEGRKESARPEPPVALETAKIPSGTPLPLLEPAAETTKTPAGTPLPLLADTAPATPAGTPPPSVRPGGAARPRNTIAPSPTPAPPWEQPGAKKPSPTPPPPRSPAPAAAESLALGKWKSDGPAPDPLSMFANEATLDLEDAPPVVGTVIDSTPPELSPGTSANGRSPAPTPPPPPGKPAAKEPGAWLASSRSAPLGGAVPAVPWPELPIPEPSAPRKTPAPVPPAADDPPSRTLTHRTPVPAAAPAASDGDFSAFDDVVDSESDEGAQADARFAERLGFPPAKQPAASMEGHTGMVTAIAAIRMGRFVVSASQDHTMRVWDLTRQESMAVLAGHTGPVTSVALGTDGSRVVSGSADQTVQVWDAERGRHVATMKGHVEAVLAVAVSPDGRTAMSGGQDRSVRLWDIASGKEQLAMSGHEQAVSALAYSGDGTIAMSASLDGLIQIWNLLDGSMMAMFPTGVLGLRAIALSRDGRRLVFGGSDGKVQVWNVDQGVKVMGIEAHRRAILSVALSPDGTQIATASDDGLVRVWSLVDGSALSQYDSRAGAVTCVAFALDGRSLAGAAARRVVLWDVDA